MKFIAAGVLLLASAAFVAGCSSRPAYYAPPPAVAYAEPPLIQVAHQNGFNDGLHFGERDRMDGHSYRPTYSSHYADTPGYSPHLGGPFWQYQSAYRDAYMRGYRKGYQRG
ncbi:MAG TPA: hypothetical protein VHB45_15375 [Alloacidobacterium sp.]|nr:hypothetical protein [Alloacidobacterium sp.]